MSLIQANLPYIQIILSVLLVTVILLQRSEAGLGAGLAGSNPFNSFYTKRGAEKNIFVITIVLGILFFVTAVLSTYLK